VRTAGKKLSSNLVSADACANPAIDCGGRTDDHEGNVAIFCLATDALRDAHAGYVAVASSSVDVLPYDLQIQIPLFKMSLQPFRYIRSLLKRCAAHSTIRAEPKNGGPPMTARALKLKVSADVPRDCNFWLENDGWNGICEELSVNVRGSSFEDAKRKMEAALQAHIEVVLRKHSRSRKNVA
jgi:predicted RNase H-like HicB family nuclease